MECKLCGSTTICAACKATIAADKDVENAALKEEVKRLRTWQVGLVEMEKERDNAVCRAEAAEAALVKNIERVVSFADDVINGAGHALNHEQKTLARSFKSLALMDRAEPVKDTRTFKTDADVREFHNYLKEATAESFENLRQANHPENKQRAVLGLTDKPEKTMESLTRDDLLEILELAKASPLSEEAEGRCRRFEELLDTTIPTADDYNQRLCLRPLKPYKARK